MSKLSDNIWFTRKARIKTSERLFSNDNHSQLLLVVYSITNMCLSVALLKNLKLFGDNTDLSLVIMSMVILVTSLLVANKNFKGRALSLKNHYIELQKLYFNALDAEKSDDNEKINSIREEYFKLLELEENHSSIDDCSFRVSQKKSLTSRQPSTKEIATVYSYKTIRTISLIILYTFPVIGIYINASI